MKEAQKYLNEILEKNDTCVLALSGGPDSMCLLDLLLSLNKDLSIICAHVNHNTRKSNRFEKEFIEEYLNQKNIVLEYYKIENYENNRFTEQEARSKRYDFLKKIYHKYNAKYLFTAHHGDDLTETIIMRILRGSTLDGYSGIKKDSEWESVRITRPLLTVTKKEIIEYLKQRNIPYVVDETNESDDYLRNRIRHHILPELEKEEKNYHLKFLKFSQKLEQSNRLLNDLIRNNLKELRHNQRLDRVKFLKNNKDMQELILKEYFKEYYKNDLSNISDKHIKISKEFLNSSKNSFINLPLKKKLYKNETYFWLENNCEKKDFCIKCKTETILLDGSKLEQIDSYEQKNNDEIHLNTKDLKLPLYLTNRKNGMKMEVKNLKGHKKVNDILIDKKIPKEERDDIPIMIDSTGKILWILGVSKSKYDLAKNENYDIIFKYIKRKEI